MRKTLICLIVLLILGSIAPLVAVAGQVYYVSPAGSDANPGSAARPWATLQHAVESVSPGDTILALSGAYVGARIERSGAPDAWITLKAAPGATVLLNAPGPRNRHGSILEIETWEGDGVVAYWVIERLEVAQSVAWGIDIRGSEEAKCHHLIVRGNRVHDNGLASGKTGIFAAFMDDLLIEGNETFHNGEHGIYVNNSSDRFTIRGNRAHHNAACGIHLNGDLSMGGDGVMSDGLIENNIIYENGARGGAGINMDGVTDTLVRNNLLYSNHASGIAVFQQDGAVCSQRNRVLNNTILMPTDGRWAITLGDAACVDNQFYNNILYSDHAYRGSINLPQATVSGLQSDHNVVVNRFTTNDGDAVISLAAWRLLGYDAHSLIAAPGDLFTDPTVGDYHLRAGSPAINAGAPRVDVLADLEGRARPAGGGYDIGAYEYASVRSVFLPLLIAP